MYRRKDNNGLPGAVKRAGMASLLAIACVAWTPGLVFAQPSECPAGISVDFNGDAGPFEIGDPIPIKVTLSMGNTDAPTSVDISHFAYNLDCAPGETYPNCTPQGNTIDFIEGSVATTCENSIGETPAPIVTMESGQVTIDFTVKEVGGDPSAIRLDSTNIFPLENTCDVTFNVVVDALNSQNDEAEVVEITGWGESDAVCTNEAESSGTSASLSLFIYNPFAVFWVTKDFTDDNPLPVDINFQCDTGFYTPNDLLIVDPQSGADGAITKGFVVRSIPSLGANCRIWEGPVPEGYTASYSAYAGDDAEYDPPPITDDPDFDGCIFNAVKGGSFYCDVTNTAQPAKFIVNKEWIINNTGGDAVKEKAHVTIYCDSYVTEMAEEMDKLPLLQPLELPKLNGSPYRIDGWLGDGESLVGLVDTTFGPAYCHAKERVHTSGVETVEDCSTEKELTAGSTEECTFVNTVFFEAIPTLSAYGKALMVLLMLGLGVLGFRRLV